MDITDRKHTEAAPYTLNTRLEQQVQERTAELLRANQELANEVLQHQLQIERSKALNRVIQTIRNSLDLETVFATATTEFVQLLQADRVCIMQYSLDRQTWQNVSYHAADDSPELLGTIVPDQGNAIADRLKQSEIIRLDDHPQDANPIDRAFADVMAGSWLIVPLQVDCALWGSLNLLRDSSLPWQESDVEVVCSVVDQLAIAIHQAELHLQVQQLNVDLERQVQTRTAQLRLAYDFESTLKQITDKVRDSLDENQILESAVKALAKRLGVGCCNAAIFDIDQGTSTIRYEYAAAIPPSRGKVSQLADFPEIYEQLLKGHHFQFCSLLAHPERGNVSMFACPISDDKGVLGDLWLVNQSFYEFGDQDIRLVQQVANQCAIAIRQARLYQAAQQQVRELEQLNRLKDDFLSTVSHELRTPMSNIKMAIQMSDIILRDLGMFKTQTNPLDRYFRVLKDECEREINLIDDLLDLAQLDSQKMALNLSEISLQSWLPKIVEPFLARAYNQQQGLELEIAASLPIVKTDLSCLERAVGELLNNACKYTPAGEQIVISAAMQAQPEWEAISDEVAVCSSNHQTVTITTPSCVLAQSNHFVVRICNSGVEIPVSQHDLIFDKFYRIPNSDPWKHGGTGLGLALVKKLVERLEGTIHVESAPGKTTFVVQFPIEVVDSLPDNPASDPLD
jgi:signal transduction histidine kinase